MAAQRPAHSPLSTPSLSPSEAEEASRIKKATCMYDDDVDGTTTQAGSEVWKSPTLSPRVIYLLMIIELNSYIHVPTFYFILLYYYYFPCVRVSRVRQAMSRARILST